MTAARTLDSPAPRSLSEEAYECLRADILNGVFAPGQPLRLEALSARYGVSFTPLREALNQLQAELLATSSGKRGFRVAPVTLKEMWETIHARLLLETEAMTLSFANGGVDWEASLVSAYHALEKVRQLVNVDTKMSSEERDAIERRHERFHLSLVNGCGSDVLVRLIVNLQMRTERYRRPWLSRWEPEILGAAAPDDDHRAIMEAALARDIGAAAGVLRRHLMATGEFIQKHHLEAAIVTPNDARDAAAIYARLLTLRDGAA